MERFYYTDPLKAGWQSKNFGMRFDQFRIQHPDDMILSGQKPIGNNVFIGWTGQRKFYVNCDSLHLLEPHHHDQALLDDGRVVYYSDKNKSWWWHQGAKQPIFINKPIQRIILRGGVTFFSPEKENI